MSRRSIGVTRRLCSKDRRREGKWWRFQKARAREDEVRAAPVHVYKYAELVDDGGHGGGGHNHGNGHHDNHGIRDHGKGAGHRGKHAGEGTKPAAELSPLPLLTRASESVSDLIFA